MDEVGRGTTVDDGLAIAFASLHHLLNVNGCRVLFATHFHELADMLGHSEDNRGAGIFNAVKFYCTTVDETEVRICITEQTSRTNFLHNPGWLFCILSPPETGGQPR